jgi:hypothetical protein
MSGRREQSLVNLAGRLYWLSHQANRHHWMGAPLDRWGAFLLVVLAGLVAARWLPGGWPAVAACAALLLALLLLRAVASRRLYLVFSAQVQPVRHNPRGAKLDPGDKLLLRASGRFEVEGKSQRFTELLAYYRSFETREHVLMAICPPSSFLGVASWPEHEIGMWYIFFKNTEIQRLTPGELCFGRARRPAVQVDVRQELPQQTSPLDVWGGYRSGKRAEPRYQQQTIYLSFEDLEDRERVLNDLAADATALSRL